MEEITKIKGVGPKIAKYFNSLGIYTMKDLINFFPRDYEAFEDIKNIIDLEVGKISTINAMVVTRPTMFRKGHVNIISVWLDDGSGRIRAYWFNIPFINKSLFLGANKVFRGRVGKLKNGIGLSQCRIYKKEEYDKLKGNLNPVYPLTKGLKNNVVKKAIKNLLEEKKDENKLFEDYLPKEIAEKRNLCDLKFAYNHIHFPQKIEDMTIARRRLVYDEFFLFSLATLMNKDKKIKEGRIELKAINENTLNSFINKLPFQLTLGQKNTINEIFSDLKKGKRLNRLIEGDVGSGKTIVAILTAILVAEKKIQTAFMAPTEILAEQHFNNLKKVLLSNFGVKKMGNDNMNIFCAENIVIAFLSGSTKEKDRKEVLKKLANGEIDIIVGTHALFSNDVVYKDLGLCIIDEQHRFGVGQRKQLEEKSNNANVIIMSATPIPRTLAMLLYSDMDISKIEDKPKNRIPIKNYIANIKEREKAYRSMKKQIDLGHQAYVICPAIDKTDDEEMGSFANYQNVTDYAERLKAFYGSEIRIGILHGKMKPNEKYSIMNKFKDREIDILVSTTVIEVGVDVPNATFIMIEDAGSFGLAELHQLRGRVGRSDDQSYALFVDTNPTEKSAKRLKVLYESNDGFYIAEEDLKLRGPGDIFGVKQSGEMDFKIADIYTDIDLFRCASVDAKDFINKKSKPNKGLQERLDDNLKMGYVI